VASLSLYLSSPTWPVLSNRLQVWPFIPAILSSVLQDIQDGVIVLDVRDMGNIKILLTAPEDTPYASGTFEVDITVDIQEFPLVPPMVRFFLYDEPIFRNLSHCVLTVFVSIFAVQFCH